MKDEVSVMRKPHNSLPTLPTQAARLSAGIATAVLLAYVSLAGTASAKPFEEYIKPTPTVAPLSSASWGVAGVLPRDLSNGIESAKGAAVPPEFYYWDGQIIKAKDGKYHMFHSTWAGSTGFQNWMSSDAFHSISETNVLGPYKRQDYVYSSHKGHNVSAIEVPDGSYAVVVGEIVPLTIYKSSSLDGPWTGCSPQSDVGASNVSLFPRHDGKFQIVERNGTIAIADTLCGHYVKQKPTTSYTQNATDSVYPKRTSIPGVTNPSYAWQEDPHIWRSGGTYHVIYSGSGDRVGWHVYSSDGITNWKDNGYAWSPRDYQKIFCYEGSTTCTAWYKMERPSVVLEDGHPTHITWAVADVDKDNQIPAGSNHGSKVIVVPFDGVAFDNDFGTGGGGASGTGGSSGTGGAGGTSGRDGGLGGSDSGGSTATGGRSGADGGLGGNGSGGATGTGGLGSSSGGAAGSGGRSGGTGGTTVVASSGGSGGAGTGGVTAGSGGVIGTGGATTGSGGHGTGGTGQGAGGQGGGNSGSTGTTTTTGGGSSSGCACAIQGPAQPRGRGALLLLGFVLLSRVRQRRSAKVRNDSITAR
jgi:MYXO-CTERM domain-containing protein